MTFSSLWNSYLWNVRYRIMRNEVQWSGDPLYESLSDVPERLIAEEVNKLTLFDLMNQLAYLDE